MKSLNDRHMPKFFPNKEASFSSRYHIPTEKRGISPDSGKFFSVQDWLDSKMSNWNRIKERHFYGYSCNYENDNTSTKFENLMQDNTKLLRK